VAPLKAAVDVTGIENARVSTRTASTFSPSASAKRPMLQKFHIWIAQEALVFDSELWAGLWESPVNLCVQLDVSIAVTCAQISSSSSLRLEG